jgi:ligand-binding sensor domain-containing protein
MREKLKCLILIMTVLIISSCKKETIQPTDITLSTENILTYVGGKDTVNAALTPSKASGKIIWSSGNPAIASVNQSGVVAGIAAGATVITATIGNVKATSTVTVTQWTVYNATNSGLAGNNVYAIAIDAQGNKWFGTNAGVSKFDGANWTTYNTANSGLAEDVVQAIVIDGQGNKWFVVTNQNESNAVINEFDGTHWTTYNNANTGLQYNTITSMAIDTKGNKWFGTYFGGALKFDGNNWTNYPQIGQNPDPIILAASADPKGNVWFGLSLAGTIWKFDGTNWTTYTYPKDNIASNSVYAMAPDKQGNMWAGFAINGAGISEFDGNTWTSYEYGYPQGSVVPDLGLGVDAIAFDAQNNKWFGTIGRGVSVFDGTNWITYNTKNSGLAMSNDYIDAIAIDAQGNKWLGNFNGGGLSVLYAPK